MLATPLRETFDQVGHADSDPALNRLLAESGVRLDGRNRTPADLRELAQVATFMGELFDGRRRAHAIEEAFGNPRFVRRLGELYALSTAAIYESYPVQTSLQGLRETLTTSDLPLLTGTDVLARELVQGYEAYPLTWPNLARRGTNNDFRDTRVLRMTGLDDSWTPLADFNQPEMTAVRERNNLGEVGYLVGVDVYARAFSLNWRMLINDDLDAFQNLPQRLAVGARRTEERYVTSFYASSTGPSTGLYTSGNANIITGNPALTHVALAAAMGQLMSQVDENGEPIMVGQMVELVIPPSLYVTARSILEASTFRTTVNGGTTGTELEVANWLRGMFRINVNPYLPIIDTTHGTTAWYLFASTSGGRPAIDMRFLRGYETPGLYQKAPDTMRLGGPVDPMLGDFETMELRYKGIDIFGAAIANATATMASEGDGS